MWLVTLFELECHWNDLQETSLIHRNTPSKEMNVKNPTAVEQKKETGWLEGACRWRLETFPFHHFKNLQHGRSLGRNFCLSILFSFLKKKKETPLIYLQEKINCQGQASKLGRRRKKKVTNKSKSNSGGNCDNSPTKLAPSSPVSPGLKRQRWIK